MKKKKAKKWIKFRHKVVRVVVGSILNVYVKCKYKVKIKKFRDKTKRPYLVLYNHQTGFDQFFVGLAYKTPVYYVASEDIFSMGFASKLIKYLVAPIPIKKQTTDISAVMNCLRVAKEGGTIAIAPEGNRTYSGRTCYFKPAIVKLAKTLKLPIAIFKIEDGYGVQPRWSDDIRKGGMKAGVSRIIEKEEYLSLTDDELYDLLKNELYSDESLPNKEFKSKRLANYIERAMFYCPDCGFSIFESNKDIVTCKKCNKSIQYLPNKQLKGVGFDFKYQNIASWYDGQCDFVNSKNPLDYVETPLYVDKARFSEVVLYKNKYTIDNNSQVSLYGDKIEVKCKNQTFVFDFDTASTVTVLGKNKINIYFEDKVYQIKGDKRMNALKYVNLYYRYKNIKEGTTDEFLGL